MGEAKLYGKSGGGLKIDGIIKDYYAYAGENISAGDFVEFVNGIASTTTETSVDTQLSTTTKSSYVISAVLLQNGNVFIAHSLSSNYYYLYGIVVTIDGTTITAGLDTALSTTRNTGWAISAKLLPNGNVFVAHSCSQNASMTSYYLHGMVVTIDGTTITAGTDTELATVGYGGYTISTEVLPNGGIFVVHSYTSSYDLYGIICNVSGTSITSGTDTAINTTDNTSETISTTLLPNGNVFIAHSYSSSTYLYGIICTISGKTITKGSDTSLSTTTSAGSEISLQVLSDGNVFIAHSYGSNYYLYGMVCTISGTGITSGTDVALREESYAGYEISAVQLNKGNVVVFHSVGSTSGYLRATIPTINGTTVTKGSDYNLNITTGAGFVISAVVLPNDTIFTAHSSDSTDYYLNAQIFGVTNNIPTKTVTIPTYETQVRNVTTNIFNGVTKTSGTGGTSTTHEDKVSVFVNPKYYEQFNMIENGDFETGIDGWSGWHNNYVTFVQVDSGYSGKCAKFTVTTPYSGSSNTSSHYDVNMVQGHIYYAYCYIKGISTNVDMFPRIGLYDKVNSKYINISTSVNALLTNWQKASVYATSTSTGTNQVWLMMLMGNSEGTIQANMGLYYDNVRIYDLTEIFGAGNEPDKATCDKYL